MAVRWSHILDHFVARGYTASRSALSVAEHVVEAGECVREGVASVLSGIVYD